MEGCKDCGCPHEVCCKQLTAKQIFKEIEENCDVIGCDQEDEGGYSMSQVKSIKSKFLQGQTKFLLEVDRMKLSELLDEINEPEKALADEKLEEERLENLFDEMWESIPFNQLKNDFEEIKEEIKNIKLKMGKLEYFARGLSVADEIYKAKKMISNWQEKTKAIKRDVESVK